MHTDTIPKISIDSAEYMRSDAIRTIELPQGDKLRALASNLKVALKSEERKEIQAASVSLITELATAYEIAPPPLKVLNARPRKVTENYATETFGDYDFESTAIRLWMRTAVQKKDYFLRNAAQHSLSRVLSSFRCRRTRAAAHLSHSRLL